jgi:hypothetical protein
VGIPGFKVEPASLDGSANTLMEVAGLLQAGRPELALTDRAKAPHAHPDVAAGTHTFATFARDQYQDAVALLAALSTRLTSAAQGYDQTDRDAAARMSDFLTNSRYQPSGQRPR